MIVIILVVVGPTGVGKTKLSIELAKRYQAIVVNCDAMQVYQELNIGTAKITEEEKEGIPHYLFDIKNVLEDYSVYDYQKDLRAILDKYKNKNIIMVGGTGHYLKAGLYSYNFEEDKNNDTYDNLNNEELYKKCLEKDPTITIHPNNRKRLVRFLNKNNIEKHEAKPLYDFQIIGLTTSRELLYERINKRVDLMIENGLINEVKKFYDKKIYSKALMTGIGYKELYSYFENKISLEEAIELIKKNSRHYAKRQYTFFNNQLDVNWFEVNFNNFDETINKIVNFIEKK